MPEIAELKLTSEFVAKHGNKTFVKIEKSPVSKVKTDLAEMTYQSFSLASLSRGKEMVIDFINHEDAEKKRMKVTLGMSGTWIYYDPSNLENEKYHKHTHLRITDENGFILGLYDIRRFAKWSWNDFDFRGRGPCPLSETEDFVHNLVKNWQTHKDFKKHRLAEIMMSQKWFSGVGNYLRAEILHRMDVNPFMTASELNIEEVKELCSLVIGCAVMAYKLGGGQLRDWKNPTGEDATSFKEWMKCYGKLESVTDKNGRTFWFDPKWK